MRIEVFEGFALVDMIYDYVKFERTRCYQDAGSFTLELNLLEHKDSLKAGNYLMVEQEGLLIENIHKYKNGNNEIRLEVTGRALSSILDRRCEAVSHFDTSQTAESQIYYLVARNFVNPSIAKRKVENLIISSSKSMLRKLSEGYEFENSNCLEMVKTLCMDSGLGFRIGFFPEQEKFVFEIYQGRNVAETVFFSEEFGNVTDAEIYEQCKEYKNVGYQNNDSVLTEVNGDVSGLERREIIVSCKEPGDVVKELNRRKNLSAAECSILLTDQFIYREDWDVGDTITFVDKELGFVVEQPVLEVKENYTDQLDIDVNFGDKIPTVFEKLERK